MKRTLLLFVIGTALCLCSLTFGAPYANAMSPSGTITEKLAEAVQLYLNGEFEGGLAVADELLARPSLTAKDSVAILEVKSILTYAKGQQYKKAAFGYLQSMAKIGPCILDLPRDIWPSELRDKWYEILKKKNQLACSKDETSRVRTIAIMPFDNCSAGQYMESLGNLGKGLSDFFVLDFSKYGGIKVVERDKLDYLIREYDLVKQGKVDQASAIKVGKMLGAQMMVFGTIMQIDGKNGRMGVRVVDVETSGLIVTADTAGRPNFVEMEKALVKDIAAKLSLAAAGETGAAAGESATTDMDAAKLYSLGLKYMDEYQYERAYEYFRKAYEKDHTFTAAKKKMEIYKPLVS